jgi:hypothetical protein
LRPDHLGGRKAGSDTKEKFDNFHIAMDDGKWLAGRPPPIAYFAEFRLLPAWSFRGNTSAMNGRRASLPISKKAKPVATESHRAFRLTIVTCVAACFLVTGPCEAQIEVTPTSLTWTRTAFRQLTPDRTHEFAYSVPPIDAQFGSGAGKPCTVHGPALGHESALIDAGIAVQWSPTISTRFGYLGEAGRGNYDSNGVNRSVRLAF